MDGIIIAGLAGFGLAWLIIRFNAAGEMIARAPLPTRGLVSDNLDSSDTVDGVLAQGREHCGLDHEVQDHHRQGESHKGNHPTDDQAGSGGLGVGSESEHDASLANGEYIGLAERMKRAERRLR